MKLEWQIRITIWLAQFIDSDANTTKVPMGVAKALDRSKGDSTNSLYIIL